jgi:hypothetical protein
MCSTSQSISCSYCNYDSSIFLFCKECKKEYCDWCSARAHCPRCFKKLERMYKSEETKETKETEEFFECETCKRYKTEDEKFSYTCCNGCFEMFTVCIECKYSIKCTNCKYIFCQNCMKDTECMECETMNLEENGWIVL